MALPPRGVPDHKLEFLIGALGSGALDASSGMNLFFDMQSQQQAKREAAMTGGADMSAGLDALRDSAMDMTSGDEYVSPSAYAARLQGVAGMYGLPSIPEGMAGGLETLFGSQTIPFDEDDKKEIAGRALMSKNSMDRASFRDNIISEYESQLGEAFNQIRGQVNEWIDAAWAQQIPPEYYAGG